MDQNRIATFVQEATGQRVATLERVAAGYSRATFIARLANGEELVARLSLPDAPLAGTEITLDREAGVYRALAATPVVAPELIAEAADGTCLLLQRMPGVADYSALGTEARELVMADYIRKLAELHRLTPDDLAASGLPVPASNDAHALDELARWQRIYELRTHRPYPALDCAFVVLRAIAAPAVERTVLCHGDVGPGNFLHDGDRVTALLDWEFAHFGDPMDDLAGWIFRAHDYIGGSGNLDDQLRLWAHVTGLALRPRDLEYYRAVTLVRWIAVSACGIDSGGPQMGKAKFLSLGPPTTVHLATVLANLLEIDVEIDVEIDQEPEPPPLTARRPEPADVLGFMRDELHHVLAPALPSDEMRRRVDLFGWYLDHLEAVATGGAEVEAAELADLAELTGVAAPSIDEGHRALRAGLLESRVDLAAAVRYLARSGHRQAALWPPSRALTDRQLTELMPVRSLGVGAP